MFWKKSLLHIQIHCKVTNNLQFLFFSCVWLNSRSITCVLQLKCKLAQWFRRRWKKIRIDRLIIRMKKELGISNSTIIIYKNISTFLVHMRLLTGHLIIVRYISHYNPSIVSIEKKFHLYVACNEKYQTAAIFRNCCLIE